MKLINIHDIPEELDSTYEFISCNEHGSSDSEEEKNDFDRAFEQLVRGTLRLIGKEWYLEFTDENYTWYVLRWS